jgi:addiction module HigA family antidote
MVVTTAELRTGQVDVSDLVEEGEDDLPPVHPGEHLRDWLDQTETSVYALAEAMRVPANRLGAILDGKRAITADTAIRLGKAIGTRAEFWLGLQTGYDLAIARCAGVGEDVERMAA